MKNERILAYLKSQTLTEEDLQEVTSGGSYQMTFGASCGQGCQGAVDGTYDG